MWKEDGFVKLEEIESLLDLNELHQEILMEEMLSADKQYKKYEDYEYEVWCFWNDYLTYQREILKRNIKAPNIVDIGCYLGLQSIIFDIPYIGIDAEDNGRFFWDKPDNKYFVGLFPNEKLNHLVDGNIVISNMSLGYRNGIDLEEAALVLQRAKAIFISAPEEFVELVAQGGGFNIVTLRAPEKLSHGYISGSFLLEREANG